MHNLKDLPKFNEMNTDQIISHFREKQLELKELQDKLNASNQQFQLEFQLAFDIKDGDQLTIYEMMLLMLKRLKKDGKVI